MVLLEGIISSMSQDLEKIREDAQSVHRCLTEHTHSTGTTHTAQDQGAGFKEDVSR